MSPTLLDKWDSQILLDIYSFEKKMLTLDVLMRGNIYFSFGNLYTYMSDGEIASSFFLSRLSCRHENNLLGHSSSFLGLRDQKQVFFLSRILKKIST
jgi:hypothetical protein